MYEIYMYIYEIVKYFPMHTPSCRSSNKDREIIKNPREWIVIGETATHTDTKYPTVVNTNSVRAQLAVNGMNRLQDIADHNRWKNSVLEAGLDLFQS